MQSWMQDAMRQAATQKMLERSYAAPLPQDSSCDGDELVVSTSKRRPEATAQVELAADSRRVVCMAVLGM